MHECAYEGAVGKSLKLLTTTAAWLLCIASTQSMAEIYKWTDSEGNVHFGDRPENTSEATQLEYDTSKAGITNSSGNTEARELLLKTIEADRKDANERRRELAQQNAERQRLCARYKEKYDLHLRSTHTYKMRPDGEYDFYSEEQHDALREKLKAGVDRHCR